MLVEVPDEWPICQTDAEASTILIGVPESLSARDDFLDSGNCTRGRQVVDHEAAWTAETCIRSGRVDDLQQPEVSALREALAVAISDREHNEFFALSAHTR